MRFYKVLLVAGMASVALLQTLPVIAGDDKSALEQPQQSIASTGQVKQDQQASCSATDHTSEGYRYATLLDPYASMQKRQQVLGELENMANTGSGVAQYYVGSLYRAGHVLPSALVDRDLEKARLYLSHAAIGGRTDAMRKLAEIELVEKHPVEAMVWAQLFAHYGSIADRQSGSAALEDANSSADLLARTFDAFGSRDIKSVQGDVAAFIEQYDASIHAEKVNNAKDAACYDMTMISPGEIKLSADTSAKALLFGREKPGVAEFLLVFGSDGNVIKTLPLDSVPDPQLLRALRPIAQHSRITISTFPARYGLLPIAFTYDQTKIRH